MLKLNIINLVLNKFDIEELKPFLEKFNQNVINRLVSGEVVIC